MLTIPIPIKTIDNHRPRVIIGKSVSIPMIAIIAPTTINTTYSYYIPLNFVPIRSKTADANTSQNENGPRNATK
jgi:hypothetical protein